ncbi:hypothetical protein [Bacillus sp. mrc49]|uniref:hypothetical protein n=1 Tax=Bacillus sp. mrc49 TaxID=2054913 RepID=UPI0012FD7637|nr:hypothetical protein [Bacillus sp. mrc49]
MMNIDPGGDFFWRTINVGLAAYDGYKLTELEVRLRKLQELQSSIKAARKATHAVYTLLRDLYFLGVSLLD